MRLSQPKITESVSVLGSGTVLKPQWGQRCRLPALSGGCHGAWETCCYTPQSLILCSWEHAVALATLRCEGWRG